MRALFICKHWAPGHGSSSIQRYFDILNAQGKDVAFFKFARPNKASYRCGHRQYGDILGHIKATDPDFVVVASRSNFEMVRFLHDNGLNNIVVYDQDELFMSHHISAMDSLKRSAAVLIQEHRAVAEEYQSFARLGAHWIPPFFSHYMEPTIREKRFDLGFMGYLNRYRECVLGRVLPQISRNFKVHDSTVDGLAHGVEVGNFYKSCRIVLGLPREGQETRVPNATSSRMFQVMGAGSFYLMEQIAEDGHPFPLDGRLCMFTDEADLIRQARFYLEHHRQREVIALAGRAAIYKEHLDVHRAAQFWALLESLRDKL